MCGNREQPKVDTSFQDWTKAEAERARREERARERRVDYGMEQIKAIFEGGRGPDLKRAAKGEYDPDTKYYLPDGRVWKPKAQTETTREIWVPDPDIDFHPITDDTKGNPKPVKPSIDYHPITDDTKGNPTPVIPRIDYNPITDDDRGMPPPGGYHAPPGGGSGTTKTVTELTGLTAEEQWEKMKKRLSTLGKGKKHAGMDPLLDARREAQEDFYYPQVRQNYSDGKRELLYALSRAGLTASTMAVEQKDKLNQGHSLEKAGVAADIDRDISTARTGLNDQRMQIEAALRSSADPSTAADAALAARGRFAEDMPELRTLDNTLLAFSDGIGNAQSAYDAGRIRSISRGSTGVNRDASRIIS